MPERARGGFTLVEVVVALTLLSVGVLAIAASGLAASRLITNAHRSEFVISTASALADSLGIAAAVGAGRVDTEELQIEWTATLSPDSLLRTIVVRARRANGADSVHLTAVRVIR